MFVLKITSIAGNVFDDEQLKKKIDLLNENCEVLKISRTELEKSRIRKNTNKGSDVGIILDNGLKLHHGDVLTTNDKFILVEQTPEKVISIKLDFSQQPALSVILGHIIGNRHRPISIGDNTVFFPIQADSEIETFKNLFSDFAKDIELSIEERVFVPHKGMNVHEH